MRRLLVSLTLALALSALGASSALAAGPEGAQKAPLFGPEEGVTIFCATGAEPTPETFGFAVLNTPGDETTVSGEVALKHAPPNGTYLVDVAQGGCLFSQVGEITTNKKGNGNLHFTTARNPAATTFWVLVLAESAGAKDFASHAMELD